MKDVNKKKSKSKITGLFVLTYIIQNIFIHIKNKIENLLEFEDIGTNKSKPLLRVKYTLLFCFFNDTFSHYFKYENCDEAEGCNLEILISPPSVSQCTFCSEF